MIISPTHRLHGGHVLLSHDGLPLSAGEEGDAHGAFRLCVNLHQTPEMQGENKRKM